MNRKYRKRKLPKYFFIISLALFLFVGIGYSVINSNLTMQGNVVRKATSWSIGFSNPVFDTGSKTTPIPTITNGTTMTMNVNLTNPGDIYAFTVDLTNNGSVPALINTLNITELTEEQKVYLRWKVEYEDESPLEVGDLLKAGETKKVHIYLEYKNLRAKDLYPSAPINLNLTVQANFYLPEETFNTVTVTKNGSNKLVQVSNLIQEATLDDFPIESIDQVIACNNGVKPSTDTNNKIVLSKVKQNATCRIESSLANAVTNSGTETSNLAILQNATTDTITTVSTTQNISIDLNGKQYIINQATISDYSILNDGVLTINGKKTNSILKSMGQWLLYNGNAGNLTIDGGTYIKDCESGTGATIAGGGIIDIRNSLVNTHGTLVVYTRAPNSLFNINNSIIENSDSQAVANWSANSIINIRKSTINAKNNGISASMASINQPITTYFCDSQINIAGSGTDFNTLTPYSKVFYYNSIFLNGTNIPTLPATNINVIQSDIACAE